MFNLSLLENAKIRMVKMDGRDIFSLYDYLEYALENKAKDKVAAARTFWNEKVKTDHQFQMEISRFLSVTRFQKWDDSQGKYVNSRGPMHVGVTMQGLQHITLLLGGKIGEAYRAGVVELATRYFAGDRTMIQEIEDNAISDLPINQLARNALNTSSALEGGNEPMQVKEETYDTEPDEAPDMRMQLALRMDQNITSMLPTMQQFSGLVPVMQQLQSDCARERHLRHQADGRLGSEVRQLNQVVRQEADFWKEQARKAEARADKHELKADKHALKAEARADKERQHMDACYERIMQLTELVMKR